MGFYIYLLGLFTRWLSLFTFKCRKYPSAYAYLLTYTTHFSPKEKKVQHILNYMLVKKFYYLKIIVGILKNSKLHTFENLSI